MCVCVCVCVCVDAIAFITKPGQCARHNVVLLNWEPGGSVEARVTTLYTDANESNDVSERSECTKCENTSSVNQQHSQSFNDIL